MSSYLAIRWSHDFVDDPELILVEIDDRRKEVRKIEYFRDGRIGVATRSVETELTGLSDCAVPVIEEINLDPQFSANEIPADDFSKAWEEAVIEC